MLGAICELDRLNRWNALANGKDLMTANHEEIRMAGMSEEEFLKRRQARKAAKEQGNKQKSDDAASEPSPIDEDAEEVDEPAKPAKKEPEESEEPVKPAKKQAEEIDEPVKPAKKEPEESDEPVRTARKTVQSLHLEDIVVTGINKLVKGTLTAIPALNEIAKSLVQGSANALLTLRVGILTRKYLYEEYNIQQYLQNKEEINQTILEDALNESNNNIDIIINECKKKKVANA